ncbi:hypothetical protein XENTR_v10021991 [Xenopus tropicalis]|nr:hypothetical protein XENTR_v10021991 [Xenopus tropicalis]
MLKIFIFKSLPYYKVCFPTNEPDMLQNRSRRALARDALILACPWLLTRTVSTVCCRGLYQITQESCSYWLLVENDKAAGRGHTGRFRTSRLVGLGEFVAIYIPCLGSA